MAVHKYKVGSFNCITFHDGGGTGPIYGYFPDIEEERINEVAAEAGIDPQNSLSSLNILYIDTGAHKVLVDAGMGRGANADVGHLLDLLEGEGIRPESIDTVIITHAHGDHVNGLIDSNGDMIFFNARHVIWREEWEFWTERDEPHAKLMELGVQNVDQIDTETEIIPGICPVPLPGHTPGHIGLLIQSGDSRLLHIVDALHNTLQLLYPEMSVHFDTDKTISADSRRKILQRAADEKLLVQTYHLPFPGLGYVAPQGTAFIWKPV